MKRRNQRERSVTSNNRVTRVVSLGLASVARRCRSLKYLLTRLQSSTRCMPYSKTRRTPQIPGHARFQRSLGAMFGLNDRNRLSSKYCLRQSSPFPGTMFHNKLTWTGALGSVSLGGSADSRLEDRPHVNSRQNFHGRAG